ncbi:MAG: mercury methylation corrinoid protein HgcA [Bryobacterales bacterium]|nr:mercury methylation corrinoid protein HgcA [Bryobacterales bacterium]
MNQTSCGCGEKPRGQCVPAAEQSAQAIRALGTAITWRDVLGGWGVRWGFRRMRYLIAPGLYRIGKPEANSPVLVTANYKLTVDTVRRSLTGLDVWLLVLDTKGVNVWCAAGKGTFGTEELVRRIQATGLAGVVEHRKLVVPQLGAVGVAAHEVKRATGFSVHYGPVRTSDIPAYLAAGMRATPAMRRVTFDWKDRLRVAPMEIAGAFRPTLVILAILALLDLVRHHRVTPHLAIGMAPFLAAVLTGGLLVPLLLPWLPSRVFALKGAVAGLLLAAALLLFLPMGLAEGAGIALLVLAITAYMAMAFTGATTFTTLAGVRAEVRWAFPCILIFAGAGAILRVAGAFI